LPDLHHIEIFSGFIGAQTKLCEVFLRLAVGLAVEVDKKAEPEGFQGPRRAAAEATTGPLLLVSLRGGAEGKARPGALFPLIKGRKIYARYDTWRARYRDGSPQLVVDVSNEIILLHVITGPPRNSGKNGPQQQSALAAGQAARRRRHAANQIG